MKAFFLLFFFLFPLLAGCVSDSSAPAKAGGYAATPADGQKNIPAPAKTDAARQAWENGSAAAGALSEAPYPHANDTAASFGQAGAEVPADAYPYANASSQKPKGARQPLMVMDEFVSFSCAVSARGLNYTDEALGKFPRWLAIRYRHFPLPQTPGAYLAAQAFECAADQGREWEIAPLLYSRPQNHTPQGLEGMAREAGLNTSFFSWCMESGAKKSVVDADLGEAARLGLRGTPDFFLGNYSAYYLKEKEEFLSDIGGALWAEYNRSRGMAR